VGLVAEWRAAQLYNKLRRPTAVPLGVLLCSGRDKYKAVAAQLADGEPFKGEELRETLQLGDQWRVPLGASEVRVAGHGADQTRDKPAKEGLVCEGRRVMD
jgi:hypothetical protein